MAAKKKAGAGKRQAERGAPKARGPAAPPPPAGLVVHEPVKTALAGLNFAVYNPRIMPAAKMRSLKASLVKHGLVLNLVVQRKADDGTPNVVIGGHQRVTAVRELCATHGWKAVEYGYAVILDVDDATAKQLNVALNRIEGEFDPHRLGEVFESIHLKLKGEDALAMGFLDDEVLELRGLLKPPGQQADDLEREAAAGLGSFARSITLTVEFATVEQRDQAKTALASAAKERGVKPGEVLLDWSAAAKLRPPSPAKGRRRRA